MPLYAIIARDRADAAGTRADNRAAHLDHLTALGDRLDRAGPMLDEEDRPTGSIVIAEFDDLAAARRFAHDDPYALAGLFDDVAITAWRRTLP